VAARLEKHREATFDSADGVVFQIEKKGKPPRLRLIQWLHDIFLMTQPPLLAVMQGGESRLIAIYSQPHRPRLQLPINQSSFLKYVSLNPRRNGGKPTT
jgi:hypothetical protein